MEFKLTGKAAGAVFIIIILFYLYQLLIAGHDAPDKLVKAVIERAKLEITREAVWETEKYSENMKKEKYDRIAHSVKQAKAVKAVEVKSFKVLGGKVYVRADLDVDGVKVRKYMIFDKTLAGGYLYWRGTTKFSMLIRTFGIIR